MQNDFYNLFKNECAAILAEKHLEADAIKSRIGAWDVYFAVCKRAFKDEFFMKRFRADEDEVRFAMQSIFRKVDWSN